MEKYLIIDSFWTFINSTFFQTIILVATLLLTYWLYKRKVNDTLKSATTILILQIKSIECNIEYLKSQGITGTAINEQTLHYSVTIFEDNAWEKYKHLLVSQLNNFDYAAIEHFYEVAQTIKIQQTLIKKNINENLHSKANLYYAGEYGRINMSIFNKNDKEEETLMCDLNKLRSLYNSINVQTHIPIEFYNGLSRGINSYNRLTGTTTFDNIYIAGRVKKDK